jgi:hypothetical protein
MTTVNLNALTGREPKVLLIHHIYFSLLAQTAHFGFLLSSLQTTLKFKHRKLHHTLEEPVTNQHQEARNQMKINWPNFFTGFYVMDEERKDGFYGSWKIILCPFN